jgi:hypothetical protein
MKSTISRILSLTLFLAARSGLAQQPAVVINEIMYAPGQGQPEWIELYNAAEEAVDIRSWILHDATSARPVITESTRLIPPNDFLIVAKDSSILEEFPDVVSRLLVMPKLPSLNNSGDDITLTAPDSTAIDILSYKSSWGGADGRSLERIDPATSSLEQSNWGTSKDSTTATPGRKNSISLKEFNLATGRAFIEGNRINLVVKNAGLKSCGEATVLLFFDANDDSIPSQVEEIDRQPIRQIAKKDSATVSFYDVPRRPGAQQFILCIVFLEDELLTDNTCLIHAFQPLDAGSLRINEIMFAPLTGQAEWVEYINMTADTIDIRGFSFTRKPSGDGKRCLILFNAAPSPVPPAGYLVLASDSSFYTMYPSLLHPSASANVIILDRSLGLSNEGDECVLIDPANVTTDSVSYSPSWHNQNLSSTSGRSLERINPAYPVQQETNWSSCTLPKGGTPCERNSVFTALPTGEKSAAASIRCTPNPFSPDGDAFEDYCVISYTLSSTIAQIRVRVYDTQGRHVRTIANNQPSGRSGEIIWNGLDDSKQRLRIGMYILLLEAVDAASHNAEVLKCIVVIASRL